MVDEQVDLDRLQQAYARLVDMFADAAQLWHQAADELSDQGRPPSEATIEAGIEARRAFNDLSTAIGSSPTETVAAADQHEFTLQALGSIITSLSTQQHGERVLAVRKLADAVALIRPRAGSPVLVAVQEAIGTVHVAAQTLHRAVGDEDSGSADLDTLLREQAALGDLVQLVRAQSDLDDDVVDRLEQSVAAAYGEPLAKAAARGRLTFAEASVDDPPMNTQPKEVAPTEGHPGTDAAPDRQQHGMPATAVLAGTEQDLTPAAEWPLRAAAPSLEAATQPVSEAPSVGVPSVLSDVAPEAGAENPERSMLHGEAIVDAAVEPALTPVERPTDAASDLPGVLNTESTTSPDAVPSTAAVIFPQDTVATDATPIGPTKDFVPFDENGVRAQDGSAPDDRSEGQLRPDDASEVGTIEARTDDYGVLVDPSIDADIEEASPSDTEGFGASEFAEALLDPGSDAATIASFIQNEAEPDPRPVLAQLVIQLLIEDHDGLAVHLTSLAQQTGRPPGRELPLPLLRTLALGRHLRHADGDLALQIENDLLECDPASLVDDEDSGWSAGIRLLLVAAVLRPALLAPRVQSSTAAILNEPRFRGLDQLRDYCRAVADFGSGYKALDLITLHSVRDRSDWQHELDALKDEIEQTMVRGGREESDEAGAGH